MKKNLLLVCALMLMIGSSLRAQSQKRICGTMDYLAAQKAADPGLGTRMADIERQTQQWINANPDFKTSAVTTVPVVVHVVYNGSAQNISDARIIEQINVLNKDYSRTNADAGNTPSVFQGVAANTQVQFCLAQRDPNGNATNGIVRKSTTTGSFSTNNNVKHNSTGGDDAWSSSSYLNIWVCNLGGGLLGYATFPGGSASNDGVVVLYSSVGGPAAPGTANPYHLGRTATHEVGHWLNLFHIWGDDGTSCSGSDQVSDTPNQADENYGCPVFPTVSCSNGPNGDMFMNYMDYTDDGCMNMFTSGQTARMQATLTGTRASIQSSAGCTPPGTSCSVPSGLSATSVTSSSATLNWNAVSGAVSYNVQYRPTGTSTWTSTTSTTNSKAISGLTTSTQYEFQVQTVCSGSSSAFSSSATFTTSAPSCSVPSGLSAGSLTNTSAALSWGAVSGAVSYNLQWKLSSSGTFTTVPGLTSPSYSLTGLTSCTSYNYQVQTVCASGSSGYSSASTFTTTGCAVTYCTSRGNNTTYEYISRVALGTINNLSGNNSGYGNYTALSTNLAGGTSNTITLTPGFTGSSYREYWKVYIDYNKNGVFTDAGENVATTNSTTAVSASFTVPTSALNGSTRMRVQMQYNAYPSNSCSTFTYGEVEDYSVNVTGNAQKPMENYMNAAGIIDVINLYPNPVKDNLRVEFISNNTGKTKMNIYNLVGQKKSSEELFVVEGLNTTNINTSELDRGIYIFEIENNNEVLRQKFIVSK